MQAMVLPRMTTAGTPGRSEDVEHAGAPGGRGAPAPHPDLIVTRHVQPAVERVAERKPLCLHLFTGTSDLPDGNRQRVDPPSQCLQTLRPFSRWYLFCRNLPPHRSQHPPLGIGLVQLVAIGGATQHGAVVGDGPYRRRMEGHHREPAHDPAAARTDLHAGPGASRRGVERHDEAVQPAAVDTVADVGVVGQAIRHPDFDREVESPGVVDNAGQLRLPRGHEGAREAAVEPAGDAGRQIHGEPGHLLHVPDIERAVGTDNRAGGCRELAGSSPFPADRPEVLPVAAKHHDPGILEVGHVDPAGGIHRKSTDLAEEEGRRG